MCIGACQFLCGRVPLSACWQNGPTFRADQCSSVICLTLPLKETPMTAKSQSARRQARAPVDAGQYPAAGDGLFRREARSRGAFATGGVRHLGPSRLRLQQRLQRGPHPADQPGRLRSPHGRRHRRAAVHRHRHPRAGGAGAGQRAGGVRGQRRRDDDRRARRLHADAGDLARHPHHQQGPRRAASPTAS